MPNLENLRAVAERNPDPVVRADQLRKIDQLAAELPEIDRRISALKERAAKPAPFFSLPAFILGLLIVGAMVLVVFSGVPKGAAIGFLLLVVLIAIVAVFLYVRRRARKAASAE